ncbi:MAG: hypothetical protein KBA67_07280 [Leptotrichiaceae bacterium]|nr:hypothetical protein [Leptotrichiaceae bacterium]
MKKNIVLSFNLDKKYDREIYEALKSLSGVGISRQGMIKRIFYYTLVKKADKQVNDESKNIEDNKLADFFKDLEE